MAIAGRGKIYPPVDFKHASTNYGLDETEWERIVDRIGRNPNDMECAVFAMLWSEAYCNKSSASLLDTIPREDERSIRIPGSRVGLIDIGRGEYAAVRVVANNTQTYVDSFFGAQTAIDMAVTELTSVGAKPLAILNLLRFGPSDQIANQRLLQGAVFGISEYANRYGIPAVGGELYFHPQYKLGTIMNTCALGIVKSDHALTRQKPPPGSLVIYVGSKTARDGLPKRQKDSEVNLFLTNKRDQKTMKAGDPLLANRMISACAEAVAAGVLRDVVSAGVGGLGTACFDLAARINNPIRLNIDRIPLKVPNMTPKEILLSESSERLLAIATKDEHRELINIFHKWDIDSLAVGQVIDADGIEFHWNHYMAADIPFQFAMGGSIQKHFEVVKFPPMLRRSDSQDAIDAMRKRKRKVEDEWTVVREATEGTQVYTGEISQSTNLEDTWLDLLANPNLCSRRPIYQLFDQAVSLNAVIPAGGDAAVLRLKPDGRTHKSAADPDLPKRALAVSVDSNSLYVGMEPYLGTVQTVAEGMRNLAASGARPIGIAHCLNFGDPGRYKEVCDLAESIRGLGDASKIWDIPILSEFVSMFNGSEGNPILPTPTIMSIGLIDDAEKICGIQFQNRGDKIFLLGTTLNEVGCSEYGFYCHHQINRLVPDINFDLEKRTCQLVCELIGKGLLKSAHDVSLGGLTIAFSECCLAGERPIGARLNLENTLDPKEFRPDALLFSETSARFLVSFLPEDETAVRELCLQYRIPVTGEGEVGGRELRIEGAVECELPLSTAYKIWLRRLSLLLGLASIKQAA
ncbi:MAG: AIR synthase related protein [Bdellovibrionota bacterium]